MGVVIVEYITKNHKTNLSSSLKPQSTKVTRSQHMTVPEYFMNCNKSSFEGEMDAVSMKPSIV